MVELVDEVKPIIGYSQTSNFDAANIPPALQAYLIAYERYVGAVRSDDIYPSLAAETAVSSTTSVFPFITLITGVFFLFKRKAQWIQLPVKYYVLLAVAGILLPLAIQLIWTHVDALSGREVNFTLNSTNLSWLAKYQVFIAPVYFAILSCILLVKKGGAKPLDCIWNLILLLSAYLFLTIAILRPIQDIEISYYTQQDKLIHSESGFTALEDQAIKELSGKLKNKLTGK